MPDETRASIVVGQAGVQPGSVESRASLVTAQAAIAPGTIETRASVVVAQVAISLADAVPGTPATGRAWGYILG